MATLTIYNTSGKKLDSITLDKKVFDVEVNQTALSEVIRMMQSNKRTPVAHAKDRSEVRGGGRKPWRQKGTGRARHGSTRSPLWRSGGATFGPRNERNFTKKINKKLAKSALRMMLTLKVQDGKMVGIDELKLKEAKTKALNDAVSAILKNQKELAKIKMRPTTLIITKQTNKEIAQSSFNLPRVVVTSAQDLNTLSLASTQYALLEKGAEDILVKRLA